MSAALAQAEPITPRQLAALLMVAMHQTLTGYPDPSVPGALPGGARALLAVREADDVDAQLRRLEAALRVEGSDAHEPD